MPVNVGTAIGYLDLNIDPFKAKLNEATAHLNVFTTHASTSAKKIEAIDSAAHAVGDGLTKLVSLPLLNIGGSINTELLKSLDNVGVTVKNETLGQQKEFYDAGTNIGTVLSTGIGDSINKSQPNINTKMKSNGITVAGTFSNGIISGFNNKLLSVHDTIVNEFSAVGYAAGVATLKALKDALSGKDSGYSTTITGTASGSVSKSGGMSLQSAGVESVNISGYYSGTDYATAGLHWVGENGPELMAFSGGEQILNSVDSLKLANKLNQNSNSSSDGYSIDDVIKIVKSTFRDLQPNQSMQVAFNNSTTVAQQRTEMELLLAKMGKGVKIMLKGFFKFSLVTKLINNR